MMRQLIFASALLVGSSVAQTMATTLEIDKTPFESHETWVSSVPNDEIVPAARIRVHGQPGDWHRVALGMYATTGPTWLRSVPQSNPSDFEHSHWNYRGGATKTRLHPNTFALELGLGLRDVLSSALHKDAVQDWHVPLRADQYHRVWDAFPPMWTTPGHGLGYASLNSVIWYSMTWGFADNDPSRGDIMSLESMLKFAIVIRAASSGAGTAAADAYFDSPEYAAAMQNGGVFLVLQAVALRSAFTITPGPIDVSAPTLGDPQQPDVTIPPLPPLGNVAIGMDIAKRLPPVYGPWPGSGSGSVIGLTGPMSPNELRYFKLRGLIPPAKCSFRTRRGRIWVRVKSAFSRVNPLRQSVLIPHDVLPGNIRMTTGWSSTPVDVGAVTVVVP